MRIVQNLNSTLPLSLTTLPQFSVQLPSIAEVYDAHRISQTSAVGSWREAINGATGEFLERRHFYNEVKSTHRCKLEDIQSDKAAEAFFCAFEQTSKNPDELNLHEFSSTEAYNLFSMESVQVPSICVSLSDKGLADDCQHLPFRDTTGCAGHVDASTAIDSALGELIERQALLRYWICEKASSEINLSGYRDALRPDIACIVDKLTLSGDLKLYDISLPEVSGYTVILVYGSKDPSRPVQYSSGLSFSVDPLKSVEKSILELWQIFILLHYSIVSGFDGERIEDLYHRHFWNMNDRTSYLTMTDTEVDTYTSLQSFIEKPVAGWRRVYEDLSRLTDQVYCYIGQDLIRSLSVTFARVFSPDLFMHMNGSLYLNHKNKISERFSHVNNDRKYSLVLFP